MSTKLGEDDDFLDDAPTDELPILLETAVLDPHEYAVGSADDEPTGEHTALHAGPASADVQAAAENRALRDELEAARAQLQRTAAQAAEIERNAAGRMTTIDRLARELEDATERVEMHRQAESRLADDVRERDSELEELRVALDRLRAELQAQQAQSAQLRASLEATQTEVAATHEALAGKNGRETPAADVPSSAGAAAQPLREEIAALTTYIDNRRRWWDALQAETDEQRRRIAELEREVGQRALRERRAEELAARERTKANELKDAMLEATSALERRDRALTGAIIRASQPIIPSTPPARAQGEPGATTDAPAPTPPEAAALEPRPAAAKPPPAMPIDVPVEAPESAPVAAAAVTIDSEEAFEIVAQLEAELEHKREQLDRREVELSERTARLATTEAESDALRTELGDARKALAATRADLERERHEKAQLESMLDDRDQRLDKLERDLSDRLSAIQRLTSASSSTPRAADFLEIPDGTQAPALVCLTSDTPRTYPLGKSTITIGRSSQCDIQIFTQFVSREHARINASRNGVVIEDLGSTNGVFVNSVRIDRQELAHGDLVTVGETQFRFLEALAH